MAAIILIRFEIQFAFVNKGGVKVILQISFILKLRFCLEK